MTIRRGEDWGSPGELAPDCPIVASDAALADLLGRSARPIEAGLIGGDLARTVGARGSEAELRSGGSRIRLPVDAGVLHVDADRYDFVAHVVIRRRSWMGPVTIVANAAFLGSWNIAPRSHPNDGRFELLHADLTLSDAVKARPRLASGTHLPHPSISVRSVRSAELNLASRARVYVDGVAVPGGDLLRFEVVPDALTIVV